jgi:hypothetical protein
MNYLLLPLIFLAFFAKATEANDLSKFKKAYPDFIRGVSGAYLLWRDGTRMLAYDGAYKTEAERLNSPSLLDQVSKPYYIKGKPPTPYAPKTDPGRLRCLAFFKKMYGASQAEVQKHLVTVYWMPHYFGSAFPLEVTTVNRVDDKLRRISDQLELLVLHHPDYLLYLFEPGGTFKWRFIANTNRLSAHSFGMTIDINADLSDYWLWDLMTDSNVHYRNSIPWPIVRIFERNGFIWGGKWHHYDTMHFEYRPELL